MPTYFDFEVTLRDIKPRIWRSLLLSTEATFLHLHEAIQDAMGWYNSHLFVLQNAQGHPIAGLPDDEGDEPDPGAAMVPVASYFKKGKNSKCLYLYDFGDGWEHDVVLKGITTDYDQYGRRLLGGERACPPEDCGGTGGYEDCVAIMRGKRRDKERRKWLDGWDPEKFDFKETERLFYTAHLLLRINYNETL